MPRKSRYMNRYLHCIYFLAFLMIGATHIANARGFELRKVDSVSFDEIPFTTLSCYDNPLLNGEYLIALNNSKNRSIAVFNKEGTNIATINYGRVKGISESGWLKNFHLVNYDSIFLHFSEQVAMIDSSGNLKYSLVINQFEEPDDTIVIGNAGDVGDITWSANMQRLIVSQYPFIATDSPAYYKGPVLAALDMQTGKFTSLPVHYPEMYQNDYYRDASYCVNERAGKNIITGFIGTTDLEIYNTKTQKVTHARHPRSRKDTVAIRPFDKKYKEQMDKVFEHLAESPLYINLVYDPYNEIYYRFFSARAVNADGSAGEFFDKEYILMAFDKDFNLLDEKNLGRDYLTFYSFITGEGLYIMKNIPSDRKKGKSTYKFDVFRVVR